MNPIPYTYQVIRYVHGPAAGEALNAGVVLYAPDVPPHLFVRFDHRYERLSATFASFDGDHFRQTLRAFESTADRLRADWDDPSALPGLVRRPDDAQALITHVWPDRDLGFQTGSLMAGITDDPVAALDGLFQRLVISQQPQSRRERRSDEEVWQSTRCPWTTSLLRRRTRPTPLQTCWPPRCAPTACSRTMTMCRIARCAARPAEEVEGQACRIRIISARKATAAEARQYRTMNP